MNQKKEFPYFYGSEADSFTFYRIPKLLVTDDTFKDISNDAKLLYGLMLDRMSLSSKNGWFDAQKRVFIYFSMEEVMEMMNCSKNKALRSLAELDTDTGIGLIERKRQGQGKPTIIYVKNFILEKEEVSDFPKKEVKSSLKGKSGGLKKGSLKVSKKDTNNTNIINTEFSNTDSHLILSMERCDGMTDVKAYARLIKENIEYDILLERYPFERELVEGIYELILEMVLSQNDSVVISSSRFPMELVRAKFLKLHSGHVEYVINCMKSNTSRVRNIKKYLLTALFNAPSTISGYYQAEVNADFPQYAKVR